MNSTDSAPPLIRCFVALPLPEAVKLALSHFGRRIQADCGSSGVRWVAAERLHLTLRFFGQVAETQLSEVTAALASIAAVTRSFTLQTKALGCFPEVRYPKVIWLGLAGNLPALLHVQSVVAGKTKVWGDAPVEPVFHPHLTLGRVKITRARELDALRAGLDRPPSLESLAWTVRHLEFIQSVLSPSGPAYRRLARISFAGTD
jgi:RNA 2',3'-cyclic 3'-phosphodiesterase